MSESRRRGWCIATWAPTLLYVGTKRTRLRLSNQACISLTTTIFTFPFLDLAMTDTSFPFPFPCPYPSPNTLTSTFTALVTLSNLALEAYSCLSVSSGISNTGGPVPSGTEGLMAYVPLMELCCCSIRRWRAALEAPAAELIAEE